MLSDLCVLKRQWSYPPPPILPLTPPPKKKRKKKKRLLYLNDTKNHSILLLDDHFLANVYSQRLLFESCAETIIIHYRIQLKLNETDYHWILLLHFLSNWLYSTTAVWIMRWNDVEDTITKYFNDPNYHGMLLLQ